MSRAVCGGRFVLGLRWTVCPHGGRWGDARCAECDAMPKGPELVVTSVDHERGIITFDAEETTPE